MRKRTPWVPILLSSLALLTVVGGIAVGHFYWTTLRSSMGQMANSMSQARERQRNLLVQLDHTQALMAAQQAQLEAEAKAVEQREEALAIAREQLAMDRQSMERACAQNERANDKKATDAALLQEAARLVETASELVAQGEGAAIASGALNAAAQLLDRVRLPEGADLRQRLTAAQARLDGLEPAGKAALATRLDALRARAAKLIPRVREPRRGHARTHRRTQDSAVRNLGLQLDTAAFALDRGDNDLYIQALETTALWLETFFDSRRPETQHVLQEIRRLASHPLRLDSGDSAAELGRLGADLRQGAETIRLTSRSDPPSS